MHQISLPQFAIERGRFMHPPQAFAPLKTAVLAIDFQCFFIDEGQPMGNPHARDILPTANRIHAAVRNAGGRVVLIQHSRVPPTAAATSSPQAPTAVSSLELIPGSSSYGIHPSIVRGAEDLTVVKRQSSPLHTKAGTKLLEILRARGIETLSITGLVTYGCCDCTAREAFQHGFNVVIASDATAAVTDDEHNAALRNLEIYYARVMRADELEAALG